MGRGTAALVLAHGLSLLTGYVVVVSLARLLGPVDFGTYGVVGAVVTVLNVLVSRGIPVAASNVIAAAPDRTRSVVRAAVLATGVLALGVGAAALVGAAQLAAVLGDEGLTFELQVAAAAAVTFAAQALMVAPANGLRRFGRQALAYATYAALRLVLVVGGAAVWGLKGAIAGLVLAPLPGGLPALFRLPRDRSAASDASETRRAEAGAMADRGVSAAGLARIAVPLVLTSAATLLLLTVDLLAFKRVGTALDVGAYAAASTLAHVPFVLLSSLALAAMPRVSHEHDPALRRRVVADVLREAGVLLALPTALLVTVGGEAATVIFGERYSEAAAAVAPLTIATAGVTFYALLTAVDAGAGRLREAVLLGAVGVVALAVAVAEAGAGSDITGAAWAVAAVCCLVGLVHLILVAIRFRLLPHPAVVAAIVLAGGLALAAEAVLPETLPGLLLQGALTSAGYALFLVRAGLMRRPGRAARP